MMAGTKDSALLRFGGLAHVSEHVNQYDWNGCGIAAFAIMVGMTYERAKRHIFPDLNHVTNTSQSLMLNAEHQAKALRKLKLRPKIVIGRDKINEQKNLLVLIEWPDCRGTYHWVVWNAEDKQYRDPSRTIPYSRFVYDEGFRLAGKLYIELR